MSCIDANTNEPLWNKRELCPPPNYTHKINKDSKVFIEIRSVCLKALSVLTSLDGLHNEGAVLSRTIYHLKWKLRTEKSFKAVEKVNRSLRRYLSLNMANLYSTFTPREPDRTEMQGYLPSQQMLEYVLVRTQSFAQLLKHVVDMCEVAGRELAMKLAVGHMWNVSLVLYAIISRIWAYARYLVFSACEWFDKLKTFLDVLLPNPILWLPEGYTFPSDLAGWLNIGTWTEASRPAVAPESLRLFGLITSKTNGNGLEMETDSEDENKGVSDVSNVKKNIFEAISTVKKVAQEVNTRKVMKSHVKKKKKVKKDDVDSRITINSTNQNDGNAEQDLDVSMKVVPSHLNTLDTITEIEDLGESVHREAVTTKSKTAVRNSFEVGSQIPDTKECSIKAISSHNELSKLICRESRLRSSQCKVGLTCSLDKLRWRLLRKAMRKYVRKLEQETSKKQYKKLLKEAKEILLHHVS